MKLSSLHSPERPPFLAERVPNEMWLDTSEDPKEREPN